MRYIAKEDKFLRHVKTKVERKGSLCMACYVPEMDLWRERKEGGGDPGQVEVHMIQGYTYLYSSVMEIDRAPHFV